MSRWSAQVCVYWVDERRLVIGLGAREESMGMSTNVHGRRLEPRRRRAPGRR